MSASPATLTKRQSFAVKAGRRGAASRGARGSAMSRIEAKAGRLRLRGPRRRA